MKFIVANCLMPAPSMKVLFISIGFLNSLINQWISIANFQKRKKKLKRGEGGNFKQNIMRQSLVRSVKKISKKCFTFLVSISFFFLRENIFDSSLPFVRKSAERERVRERRRGE